MKITRAVALFLLLTTLMLTCSCVGDSGSDPTATVEYRSIIEGNSSAYTIVYSASDDGAKATAEALSAKIKEITGVAIPCVGDDAEASIYEILVGKSLREESSSEKRSNNYSVKFSGTKLVISAGSSNALSAAIDALVEASSGEGTFDFARGKTINYTYVPENTVADGATDVILITPLMADFMNVAFSRQMVWNFAQGKENIYMPLPLSFTWEDNGDDSFTFVISEKDDFSDAKEKKVADTYVTMTNFKVATKYYWKVLGADGAQLGDVHTFTTTSGQPRTLSIDGVVNTRDIGGYVTEDGKRIKQGMIYRTATLDWIAEEGINTFVDELGLKTELDLRSSEDGEAVSNPALRERGVEYINIRTLGYMSIMNKGKNEAKDAIRDAVRVFADPANYPIAFHCAIGTDRTGTLALLIEGLLGATRDDLYKEYQLSWFFALNPKEDDERFTQFHQIYDRLKKGKFNGNTETCPTLAENIAAYLMEIGVTEAEIASIRSIMLEDAE